MQKRILRQLADRLMKFVGARWSPVTVNWKDSLEGCLVDCLVSSLAKVILRSSLDQANPSKR